MHRRVEEDVAAARPPLRRVHRHVGVAQQLVHPILFGDARDPDARPHAHRRAGRQLDRMTERLHDAVGDDRRVGVAAHVLQQHRELVAAQARDGVAAAGGVEQASRNDRQQLVAGRMPHRVVDRLEVVEVEEHHREQLALARGARQRVRHPVAEERAVGEPGELVVEGLAEQLRLQRLALRDVLHDRDQPRRFGPRRAREREAPPRHVPCCAQVAHLRRRRLARPARHLLLHQRHRLGVLAGRVVVQRIPRQLGGRHPEELGERAVDLHHARRLAEQRHAHSRLLEDGAEARVGVAPGGDPLGQRALDPGRRVRRDRTRDQQHHHLRPFVQQRRPGRRRRANRVVEQRQSPALEQEEDEERVLRRGQHAGECGASRRPGERTDREDDEVQREDRRLDPEVRVAEGAVAEEEERRGADVEDDVGQVQPPATSDARDAQGSAARSPRRASAPGRRH